jgi:hypothetical protein
MEMQVIVAMVARRFEVTLAPGWQVEPDPGTVLTPRLGVGIVLASVGTGA